MSRKEYGSKKSAFSLIYVVFLFIFIFPISLCTFENNTRFLCVFFLYLDLRFEKHEKSDLEHNAVICIFGYFYLLLYFFEFLYINVKVFRHFIIVYNYIEHIE
jgi:succinate-acetate transporter protein